MTDVLNVSVREEIGTNSVRRLRSRGLIPAVLYGHGKENVSLSVPSSELHALLRHGAKMVDLGDGLSEKALIRAVQWDAFGTHVLHLDLNRVSATEQVIVTVPVELRGEAPGTKSGGVLEHRVFNVEIECPAGEIPEKLTVSIRELGLGEVITVSEIPLPEHLRVLTNADSVVVSCHVQGPSEDDEDGAEGAIATGAEPEVIGRKAEDSEEGAD